MKKRYDIKVADTTKILFAWYLLQRKEELGFRDCDLNMLTHVNYENEWLRVLKAFYDEQIITEIEISKSFEVVTGEGSTSEENIYVSRKKPERLPDGFSHSEKMPEEMPYAKDFSYDCNLKTANIALQDYIDCYLQQWLEEELYFTESNMLKCERQIGRVTEAIFSIIWQYSYKHFLIGISDISYENSRGLDFTATLLFLEKKGIVTIEGYDALKSHRYNVDGYDLFFRISLTDRFFQFFSKDKKISCGSRRCARKISSAR